MARKRFITSDMSTDEKLADIAIENPIAALMWPWFITAFDDWGRLDVTSPTKIKLEVFPAFPFDANEITKAIEMYSNTGLVFRYSINKKTYIAIEPCKYYKYQTYIKEKKRIEDNSSIPAPINAPWENCARCRALARTVANSRGFGTLSVPSPSPSPSPSREDEEEETRARANNTEPDKNQEGKVFEFYNQNIGLISPHQAEVINSFLDDGMSPNLVMEILKDSLGKSDKWSWAKKVMQNCIEQNIFTVEQYNAKKVEMKNEAEKAKSRDSPNKKSQPFKPKEIYL